MLKNKWFILPLLILILAACTPETQPPAAAPPGTPAPLNEPVQIRLKNNSDLDFEAVELHQTDGTVAIGPIPAGDISAPITVSETYQQLTLTVTAGGETYFAEPLDHEPSPITAGSFLYTIEIRGDLLLVNFEPDSAAAETSLDPLIATLQEAGATVTYEPSIQRENIFAALFGATVATREILQVNGARVDVYVFADETAAQNAAASIERGGNSFSYPQPDSTVERVFADTAIGMTPRWWLYQQFIVHQGGPYNPLDTAVVDLISTALDTTPLYDPSTPPDTVQIRLFNLSQHDFDHVTIDFPSGPIGFGSLPAQRQSAYHRVDEAYHYGTLHITADGQTYDLIAIDYVDETPLQAGYYTYLLDLVEGQVVQAVLADGVAAASDAALLDKTWYWAALRRADGTTHTPVAVEELPALTFTTDGDPNQPGLMFGGYDGCNWIGGAYWVSEYGYLVIGNVGGTERGCGAALDSAQLLHDALRGINTYTITADSLTLYTATGDELLFTLEPPSLELAE